jgi:carboxyl-terminal processing protease
MLKFKQIIPFILVASISFSAGSFLQSKLSSQNSEQNILNNSDVPSEEAFANNPSDILPVTIIESLEKLWLTIESEGLWSVDQDKVQQNLLAALSQSTEDPYSEWLTHESMQLLENHIENAYEGMGFDLISYKKGDTDTLIIGNILENSAAYFSELKVGDQLITINGVNLMGQMSLFNSAKSIQTHPIHLEVKRGDEKITSELMPIPYQEPPLSHYPLDGDIYYIDINTFSENLADELYTVLTKLKSDAYKAVVFDVRYNFGGYMSASYDVLSMLITSEHLGYISTKNTIEPISRTQIQLLDLPYAVLINRETYSAAEFFAQSLNTYSNAFLLGETTHGKGTMQGLYTSEEGTLKLSQAFFSATQDSLFEGVGIKPTHSVDFYSDFTNGDNAVFYAHTFLKEFLNK